MEPVLADEPKDAPLYMPLYLLLPPAHSSYLHLQHRMDTAVKSGLEA
jgi:hypothetical protein